jgi:diguanylate cyclase (GGDEF)-like protein
MFEEMARWWKAPEADESFLQFRERSIRDGAWLSYVVGLVILVYVIATWQRDHRGVITALVGTALAGTYVLALIPPAKLVRVGWREAFFLAWSAVDVLVLGAIVIADGGAGSALVATFFLPLIFGALSYPPTSVAIVGTMSVAAYAGSGLLTGAGGEAVGTFSALLATGAVMGVSQAVNRDRQRRELALLSRSDPLTGALNRRGFAERFAAELADRVRRDGRPLGLIVIDLDDFKRVNDTQGHATGDALLCTVADTLGVDLRPSDALGRLGGDEFAVLLAQAGPGELRAAAARIEQRLGPVAAASLGIAALPADGDTAEALHRSADADLYRAKQRRAATAAAA